MIDVTRLVRLQLLGRLSRYHANVLDIIAIYRANGTDARELEQIVVMLRAVMKQLETQHSPLVRPCSNFR